MSALSDLLVEAKGDMSVREIARRTEAAGQPVAHGTIAVYVNGRHGEPDDRVLRALAAVLPVRLSQLRDAAGVPVGARGPYEPPDVAHRLNLRQRRALDEMIRAMVDTDEGQETTDAQGATIHALPGRARKRAASKQSVFEQQAAYAPDEQPAAEREESGDDGGS